MYRIKNVLMGVLNGIKDAMLGLFAVTRVMSEERNTRNDNNIAKRLFECIVLNGFVFLCSILLFNYVILKGLHSFIQFIFGSQEGVVSMTWFWLEPTLSYFFSVFWVLPLFLLSRVVNALWFQDIADHAFRGRRQSMRNIPVFIADTLFSWELHRRLHFIENNWSYFLGFGLPLATATYLIPNYLLSGAIFSIFFPLFIISANEVRFNRENMWSVLHRCTH
ncbi:unnamed protein product [Medioppia subpectinata]|uniref:Etoposide-induced protein 2.4 n=1 Tax=Medioppia subpectinata TaxID=1979941 RepID=A0A7R9KTK6_9ACAR|nr:unnamed protein product [Medioppia subpectinata]CAG2109219.1 unnamed protein product [Medioppia subpectinata]